MEKPKRDTQEANHKSVLIHKSKKRDAEFTDEAIRTINAQSHAIPNAK